MLASGIQKKRVAGAGRLPGLVQVKSGGQRSSIHTACKLIVRFDLLAGCSQIILQVPGNQIGAQVGRHRVEATAGDNACPGGRCLFVMAVNQVFDPGSFAGDVYVVGRKSHAGIDQLVAIKSEWAGSAQYNPRLRSNLIESLLIAGVGDQDVSSLRISACLRFCGFERLPVSSGNRPSNLGRLNILSKVLYGLPSGEAAGSVKHDVVFAVRHKCRIGVFEKL